MRWWTSDTHFGHKSILGFGRGRWSSIGAHDRELIDNWNDVVGFGDEVWHLGDVAWSFGHLVETLPRLNGRITLVAGNHDSWWPHYRRGFVADERITSTFGLLVDDVSFPVRTYRDWRRRRAEVEALEGMDIRVIPGGEAGARIKVPGHGRVDVDVSHLPERGSDPYLKGHLEVLAPRPTGTARICGHVHGLWAAHGRSINVGVDVNDWRPVAEDVVAERVRAILDGA